MKLCRLAEFSTPQEAQQTIQDLPTLASSTSVYGMSAATSAQFCKFYTARTQTSKFLVSGLQPTLGACVNGWVVSHD